MENSLSNININSNSNSWKIALAIAIPIAIVPKMAIAIAVSILLLMSARYNNAYECVHRSTKRGQIEKTGTKEITIQGCSYDPKGSFGSEKVGA